MSDILPYGHPRNPAKKAPRVRRVAADHPSLGKPVEKVVDDTATSQEPTGQEGVDNQPTGEASTDL